MKDDNNYEEEVAVDGKQREGIGAVYIWIPALVSFVAIAFVLALKLTEKELNSFEPILNKIDDIDLHANFSDENDNYIIDINLMAKEECEEEETDDEEE